MGEVKEIFSLLGGELSRIFRFVKSRPYEDLEEIRIRVGQPLLVRQGGKDWFIGKNGEQSSKKEEAYLVSQRDLQNTVERLSQYSLYAFQEELKNGFLTVAGGHRVGFSGKIVLAEGKVKTLGHIFSLNIRISKEIKGCADKILPFLHHGETFFHTLILSPPGCGKTTLLRDVIRQVSNGVEGYFCGKTVGVVDERGEIAGCYLGIPQKDVGIRTDVLDGCPKVYGMEMLLRSMSPEMIAVDELGGEDEKSAIEHIINSGVTLFCTAHGRELADLSRRPFWQKFLEEKVFGAIVVLGGGTGVVQAIYNRDFVEVYRGEGERSC